MLCKPYLKIIPDMKKKNKNKIDRKFRKIEKRLMAYDRLSPGARTKLLKEYCNTDLWQERKVQLFEKYGRMCEICSSKIIVQVHHNNYETVGCESDKDLTILCRECHNFFHSRSRVKSPSKCKPGYWHKGHYVHDDRVINHRCSMCSYEAKYAISRDARGRHILFCQKCLNIFRLKLVGNTGEELKTGMPVTVPSEEKPPPLPAPSVRRRRKNNT